jgi:1,4-dihydroxy-2-naphthoate polyprenyltransferase
VLIFFGPVAVMGTEYVLLQNTSLEGFLLGTACGLLATSILVVNNTRDIEEDRSTGKKTLPARYGRNFATYEFLFCLILSYLLALTALSRLSDHAVFICLILPLGLFTYKKLLSAQKGEDFNALLPLSGMHLLTFSLMTVFLIVYKSLYQKEWFPTLRMIPRDKGQPCLCNKIS